MSKPSTNGTESAAAPSAAPALTPSDALALYDALCELIRRRVTDAGDVSPATLLERVDAIISAMADTVHRLELSTATNKELSMQLALIRKVIGA